MSDEIKEVSTDKPEEYSEFIEEHFEDKETIEELKKQWNKINTEMKSEEET